MSVSPPPLYNPAWRVQYKECMKGKGVFTRLDSVSTTSSPSLSPAADVDNGRSERHPLTCAVSTNRSRPSDLDTCTARPPEWDPAFGHVHPTPPASRTIFDGVHHVEILDRHNIDQILTRDGKETLSALKKEVHSSRSRRPPWSKVCRTVWVLLGYAANISAIGVLIWQCHFVEERHAVAIAVASVFFALASVLLLVEASCSIQERFQNLENRMSADDAVLHVQDIRKVAPIVTWEVECYHYADRPAGRVHSEHGESTHREKIVTYRNSIDFRYKRMQDISGDISGFQLGLITRVELKHVIGFIDENSRQSYVQQRSRAMEDNRYRDQHMDFCETIKVRGGEEPFTVFLRKEGSPGCATRRLFFMCPTFLDRWSHRPWFSGGTAESTHMFFKLLGD